MLNLGLSGVPISGSDVGGFATGPIPDGTTTPSVVRDGRVIGGVTDPELFVRWMQLGSFLPWFRNHYLGYDKEYQEVYAYGEPVTGICRRIIERRYRMLQLYYDAMYEWTRTGMPIARALFLNDPDDPAVYQHLDDQFFVGKDILVAPILFPAPVRDGASSGARCLSAGRQRLVRLRGDDEPLDAADSEAGRFCAASNPRSTTSRLRARRRDPADAIASRTVRRRALGRTRSTSTSTPVRTATIFSIRTTESAPALRRRTPFARRGSAGALWQAARAFACSAFTMATRHPKRSIAFDCSGRRRRRR